MKLLLSKARARVVRHLVLDKGALALAIGMLGLILLLLIGTQVVNWYWPVLLAAVSLGIGVYQLRKNIPSRYEVAQQIDHRLALSDSLSTAVYFSEHPKPGFEAVCAAQYQAAEQLALGVNLPQALPWTRSRYLLPAVGLFLVAGGLFAVRYLMIGSLDLQSSLVEAVADTFFSGQPEEAVVAKAARKQPNPGAFDPSQPNLPPPEPDPSELTADAEKGQKMQPGQENQQQDGSGDEKGPGKSDDEGDENSDQNGPPKDKQGDKGREGQDKGQNAAQGQDQRSMLDKLRDAVSNMMNQMNSNDAKQNAQKGGDKQKAQKQDKGGEKGEKGDKASDDAQADANNQSKDGKPQEGKKSNAPGQKPSDSAESGAGENEGKKDIENAKLLEAMGKMSELLGERSSQISGDMTVEVGQTKQQLQTAMTQQKTGHTDAGGEIHRDQVPLADQLFVEQYFKEVRKSTPAPKGPAKGAKVEAKK